MPRNKQLIACAALDGCWRKCDCREQPCEYWIHETADDPKSKHWCDATHESALPYDTFNSIISLIQKQDRKTLTRISLMFKGQNNVAKNVEFMMQSPAQLRELLLKSRDAWRDE